MTITQSETELKKYLSEQLMFIKKSSKDFDKGDVSEAKRLATSIRVLLHDTDRSISLLSLLGDKGKTIFLDSSIKYDPTNLMPHIGLIKMNIVNDHNGFRADYKPLLDSHTEVNSNNDWKSFDLWWGGLIIKDQQGKQFSRKDLILNMANKDGGAHVDKELDKNYEALSRRNSIGYTIVEKNLDELKTSTIKNIELASVRQIAFEVDVSLAKYYNIA